MKQDEQRTMLDMQGDETVEFRLAIRQHDGRITLPGQGGTHAFDILTIDLTGDTPRIAIMRKRDTPVPPAVA